MHSWMEKLGGGGNEPPGGEAAPATGEPIAKADEAAAANDGPVPADEAAVAGDQPAPADEAAVADDQPASADEAADADDQPTSADHLGSIVAEHDGVRDDQDVTAAAGGDGNTAVGESEPDLAAVVPAATAGGYPDEAVAGDAGIGGRAVAASEPSASGPMPDMTAGVNSEPAPKQNAGSGTSAGRWPEIQAMFVDDPRASVELAADLMDDSVETFVASVRQLQGSLRSTWGGSEADTEQLRKALQRYRALWRQLHGISFES